MSMRQSRVTRPGWQPIEWILGIVGGIATFLGFFILFGPEDDSIGIGGDLSWEVSEISSAWTYSLLIGGLVLVAVAVGMAIYDRMQPREGVPRVMSARADLYTHAGIFVLVNAFIWLQDIALGGGVSYAYWTTIPWGLGLLAHAVVHFYRSSQEVPTAPMVEEKEKEKEKELLHH